jgi:DNA-binding response OmpR family regulator
MLPRMDGFTVIRKMREDRLKTQTIILSARDSMSDVVHGLDAGADDYLTKPFALDVLLARMRAAARRVAERPQHVLRLGDLSLYPQTCALHRGDRVEQLTRTEYALLETLMRRPGNIVPREVLINEGWGLAADVSVDSLYVFIRSLRTKITHPGETEMLHTVRGVGYMLRTDL